MPKKSISASVFLLDLCILYITFLLCYIHYNGITFLPINSVILMIAITIVWFIIALNTNATSINIETNLINICKSTVGSYSVLCCSVVFMVAVFGDFVPNSKILLWPLFYSFFLFIFFRAIFFISVKHYAKNGGKKLILLIGGDRVAERVMKKIQTSPELGYELCGILADYYHNTLPEKLYLGKLDDFSKVVSERRVDEVIIALPLRMRNEIYNIVEKCECEGIRLRIVPDFFRLIKNRPVLDKLDDIPMIGIRTDPLNLLKNRVLKRTFDIITSVIILAAFSPFMLLISCAIKISSRGPIIFKQERIGANNEKFIIYKFRSMRVQNKSESDTTWTTDNDRRITSIGKILRKYNLDELPQLWNVFIGDMSIVGPRPEREFFVEKFKNDIWNYKVRHFIKSGITGLAQVEGWRGDTCIRSRVKCDIEYIENWSFWFDIKIILFTFFGKKAHVKAH